MDELFEADVWPPEDKILMSGYNERISKHCAGGQLGRILLEAKVLVTLARVIVGGLNARNSKHWDGGKGGLIFGECSST